MIRNYEGLTLRDDFIFGKVMQNRKLCKELLETLLEIKIDYLDYPEEQKRIRISSEGKEVRLDVYVKDQCDIVYDAEMQNRSWDEEKQQELPLRSRYYQGMIDLNLLEKGKRYIDLNESYVIFLCTYDPFGAGYCCYTFRNMCMQNTELMLADKTTKIFFNTTGNVENATDKQKELFRYIEMQEITGDFSARLHEEVCKVRENRQWRREYMKTYTWLWEAEAWAEYRGKKEGRKEGREEGREEGYREHLTKQIAKKLEKGLSEEQIAEDLEESLEVVEAVSNKLRSKV